MHEFYSVIRVESVPSDRSIWSAGHLYPDASVAGGRGHEGPAAAAIEGLVVWIPPDLEPRPCMGWPLEQRGNDGPRHDAQHSDQDFLHSPCFTSISFASRCVTVPDAVWGHCWRLLLTRLSYEQMFVKCQVPTA